MSFVNSNVIVLNNSGATHSFQTGVGSPLSVAIPAGSTGTWTFVVNRAGYEAVYGTFDAAGGGVDTAAITQRWRQQATGADLFSGSTQALITVSFTDAQCTIAIGDGTVTPQEVIDAVETALMTEAGMRFLASNVGSQSSFAVLGGQSFLLLGQAYRLARRAAGDDNSTLAAFAISADGTPVDGVNGPVAYLSAAEAVTPQSIRDAMALALSGGVTPVAGSIDTQLSEVPQIVWQHDVSGFTTEGQAGKELLDAQSASVDLAPVQTVVDAILVDTNELQLNQGNWLTATGFSTHTVAQVVAAMQVVADDFKASTTTVDLSPVLNAIAALNDVSAVELETALLNDADGQTFKASLAQTIENAILNNTDGEAVLAGIQGVVTAALTNYNTATATDVANVSVDLSPLETKAQADARQAVLVAEHDATQSAINGLSNDVNVVSVGGTNVTGPDDLKANVSNLSADVNVISVAGTNVSGVNDFKADVSALETKVQADARTTVLVAEHDATQAAITNLNDLNEAQVNAQVDAAMADYDGPTKAEVDASFASLLTVITGTATTSTAFVADSSPTAFEQWMPRLEPYLIGAPQPIIESRLIEAAIEACEDAAIWAGELAEIPTVLGQNDYEIPALVNSQIHSILSVKVNGRFLNAESGDFFVNERGLITLRNAPKYDSDPITQTGTRREGILVTVSLKPTQEALALPGILWRDYQKMVAAGALSKAHAMPNRAWSSEELAAKYRNIFEEEMADARRAIDRGFITTNQKLETEFFAAPTQHRYGAHNSPAYRGQV